MGAVDPLQPVDQVGPPPVQPECEQLSAFV